ncbi:MAG: AsmA-like C-terminal region-containing protein [Gemmataceae bacterium]
MRRLRLLLLVLTGLALIAGCAYAGIRLYFRSDLATLRVAARLSQVYGAAVELDHFDARLNQTAFQGVRFFQIGDLPGDAPWLSIKEARTDLSFMDFAFDQTDVSHIELTKPVVTLHFDKEGRLLTRVPKPKEEGRAWPSLAIHQGFFRLQQEGHPDFVVNGIEAVLELRKEGLVLEGTIEDPFWGSWQAKGDLNMERLNGQLRLVNEGTHVTQEKLDALPFVPAATWEDVKLDGETPIDFTFSYDLPADRFGYLVLARPIRTNVFVSSIDLHAVNADGCVRIDNGSVYLEDVHGETADGQIATSAEMRCRQQPKEMHFNIAVNRLDLRKLPASWHLQRQLAGRLDGTADLHVIVRNHQPRTSGQGQGIIKEAHLAGFPVFDLGVLLQANGDTFEFKRIPKAIKP